MSDPIRIVVEVACSIDHAFATWTERLATWWPADHTVSGAPAAVVLEGWVGGRIYERARQGEEHDWGVVTAWRPPEQIAYRWHLGVGPDLATDVTVRFSPVNDRTTTIEIEQSGWDRLGVSALELRRRNQMGWESLVQHARSAMERRA
jgi:Activator of Hsp90 ATPase homolog 1-like protein